MNAAEATRTGHSLLVAIYRIICVMPDGRIIKELVIASGYEKEPPREMPAPRHLASILK